MIKVYKNGGYGSLYISIRTDNVELYKAIEELIDRYNNFPSYSSLGTGGLNGASNMNPNKYWSKAGNTMISREEAIFELSLVKAVVLDPDFNSRAVKAVDMAIEALSQPERPKGRWVRTDASGDFDPHYAYCNQCKYAVEAVGWPWKYKTHYCPNCGADMRGEEE